MIHIYPSLVLFQPRKTRPCLTERLLRGCKESNKQDGDVPRSTSYGDYISQLIRFARASSYDADFNTRNKLLT